jgi:virulence factor Mce-like protein
MTRRGTASIVASPVLVGAVTVLIIVVSVFLAYNANQGLPFVPTYDLKAELPTGANLVVGNEVRVGGFRVGTVDEITPRTVEEEGETRSVAVVDMSLDKVVEPLASDTQVIVRPRSALGLKYVELTPGTSEATFAPGDTIPLANAGDPVEFDDFLNTFDQSTRDDSRAALQGFGDALAGRGQSINVALQELPVFFTSLTNVMDTLNDEDTELDQFFLQIGRVAAQVAPVSEVQAELFTNMADTFEAFSRDPVALQDTIEGAPPTLDAGIESFPVQRPFLADFTELSNRLRPAAQELPRSLPAINSAFAVGSRILDGPVPPFNRRVEDVLAELDRLAEDPNTLLALQDLDETMSALGPLIRHVGPHQTVCNSLNYFFTPLAEHQSEVVPGGTIQRVLIRLDPGLESGQINRFGAYGSNRPADIPANQDPDHEEEFYAFHGQAYQPAVDENGNADCQNGQNGFPNGPYNGPGPVKYGPEVFDNTEDEPPFPPAGDPPNENAPTAEALGGGSSTVTRSDNPGNSGPVFIPNDPYNNGGLGPRNLREVP